MDDVLSSYAIRYMNVCGLIARSFLPFLRVITEKNNGNSLDLTNFLSRINVIKLPGKSGTGWPSILTLEFDLLSAWVAIYYDELWHKAHHRSYQA